MPENAYEIIMQSKILVIDDHAENLNLLTNYLSGAGFVVFPVKDGHTAFKFLEKQLPDLILLDVAMPGMDGFEICHELKRNAMTRDIPVVFITALTELSHKVKGFELGGIDYITKPFQQEEVLARINTHLMNRKLQQQLRQEHERFRGLSEVTFEGIIIHQEGCILEVNQAIVQLTGYQRDELIRMNVLELLMPDARDEVEYRMRSGNEQPYETRGLKKDRTIIPIQIQARSITWKGEQAYVVAIRDVSWRAILEQENQAFRISLNTRERFGEMVGRSPAMQKAYERIAKTAASDETVIIYGETGTGKELAARMIFQMCDKHTKTFVPVNCGAIQENLFESQFFGYRKGAFTGAERDTSGYFDQAQGGTLFLDEVGELSLLMQAKLLRVLNDKMYTPVGATTSRFADIRIIAATNQELRKLKNEGKIREDFFHRLHVIAIELPSLRQHKEDIPLLIKHFLQQYALPDSNPPTIPPQIIERLYQYDWPGNIRELFNELRRYLTTGELELSGSLHEKPPELNNAPFLREGLTLQEAVNAFEHFYIIRMLRQYQGQKSHTAHALGVDRRTLYSKLKKYSES